MDFYSINGEIINAGEAKIGITDLALLRAFGIFDYFRFAKGKPVFMEDHLKRFQNSADLMGLEVPFTKELLKKQIFELVQANGLKNVGLQLVLTGGYAEDGFTPSKPNLIMLAREFTPAPKRDYENGIKLMLWKHVREIPEVKTINYIVPIFSLKKREENGAMDILYHDRKKIFECSRTNIFIVSKDGKLITPENGILKGITRKHTLEVAKENFQIELRDVAIEEVKNAKEVFTTSTSKRIMPVVQIDNFVIGNGQPGAITLQLSKLFQTHIDNLLENDFYLV